jgi:WD40 repeat protein
MKVAPNYRIALLIASLIVGSAGYAAEDAKPPTVSFERDVQPVLRKRCGNCHNTERPRGELDLSSYASVLAGAATGKVVVAGEPEDSPLYTLPAHLEDPHMPPNAPKIPQREIDVLRGWIAGGLVEKSGGAHAESPAAAEVPGGLVAPRLAPRAAAVAALAVSPTEPILAVSGHMQVLIYELASKTLQGALRFPEGDVFALRFSRDGRSLLAAGGLGAESGSAVVFDTKHWTRTATLGHEPDAVLCADLAPDGTRVVLGGPMRVVKVLGRPGGEVLHTFRKPTDWVTAAGFSPDGLLVAAGDRFGGLFLWETRTGQEFLVLRGHNKGITALAWTSGADGLVTAGDDGAVQVWDLHQGRMSARWEAHAGGVLGLDVDAAGRIVSVGRDRRVKVWAPGGSPLAELGPTSDQATRVAWMPDARTVVSGDWSGQVLLWNVADATSSALPAPVLEPRSTALTLVEPTLTPVRPHVPKPAAVAAAAAPADDLDAALTAAREAAAAAERTVARLTRLAPSRGRAPQPSTALAAAKAALDFLRAAVTADPDNTPLARAVEETERAVRSLEAKVAPVANDR